MKINFKPVKNFFLVLGRFFWQKIILFFLFFLLLDALFIGILLAESSSEKLSANATSSSAALLNQDLFNKAFNRWQAGRLNIEKLPAKQYNNFFKDYSTSTPTTASTPVQEPWLPTATSSTSTLP